MRNFIWDGENIARQTDVNGATDRNYTLNPQLYGELISQDGPAFHHYDALGSTRNLTDTDQAITDTRDYTAFGRTNASSGTNLNRFWWLGKWGYYLQPDLGNVWVRARIEEPVDGRWKSRDPLQIVGGASRLTGRSRTVGRTALAWVSRGESLLRLHRVVRDKARSEAAIPPDLVSTLGTYTYAGNSPVQLTDPSGQILAVIGAARILYAIGSAAVGGYCAVAAASCLARWWDDYWSYQNNPKLSNSVKDRLANDVFTGRDEVLMGCLSLVGMTAGSFLSAGLGPKILKILGAKAAPL